MGPGTRSSAACLPLLFERNFRATSKYSASSQKCRGSRYGQKAVMISHANVIANVLQHVTYDSVGRARKGVETQAVSGFLPFSHIYGLVIACHTSTWRGDQVIVLPKFELKAFLESIQRFKIRQLLLVSHCSIRISSANKSGPTHHHQDDTVEGYLRKVRLEQCQVSLQRGSAFSRGNYARAEKHLSWMDSGSSVRSVC